MTMPRIGCTSAVVSHGCEDAVRGDELEIFSMFLTFECPRLGPIRRRLEGNEPFLMDVESNADIGAVIAACAFQGNNPRYLLVKKAHVTDYPYSGMWALPGGMVRIQNAHVGPELLKLRAIERMLSETNVVIPSDSLRFAKGVPPATEYPVKGKLRTVIVVPFVFQPALTDAAIATIYSTHQSVDAVQVVNPLPLMPEIAPANRVILARLIWPGLESEERDAIRNTVTAALNASNAIARRIHFPEIQAWF